MKKTDAFTVEKTGRVRRQCKSCRTAQMCAYAQKHRETLNQQHVARYRERYQVINKLKEAPCHDCGRRYPPYVMDFDHRDGTHKVASIAKLLGGRRRLETILAEVAKCDLVCANCHRERTQQRRVRKLRSENRKP